MNLNVAFKRTYDDQSSTSIDASTLDALQRKVETAYEELEQLEEKSADSEKLLRAHMRAYHIGRECLRLASEEGRRIWTTFNVPFMVSGILVCVLSAVIRVTYLLNAFDISINRIGKAALFLFLMELCGLFSNSYIEAEHLVTMFATVTLSLFVLFDSFSKDASRSVCLGTCRKVLKVHSHCLCSLSRYRMYRSCLCPSWTTAVVSRPRADPRGYPSSLGLGEPIVGT